MAVSLRIVGIYCSLEVSDAEYNQLLTTVPQPRVRDIMELLATREAAFSFKADDDINSIFTRETATLYQAKFTVTTPAVVSGSGNPIPVDRYELIDTFDNNTSVYQEFQYYVRRPVDGGGVQDITVGNAFVPFGSQNSPVIEINDQIIWRMVSIVLPETKSHPLKERSRMRAAGLRMASA